MLYLMDVKLSDFKMWNKSWKSIRMALAIGWGKLENVSDHILLLQFGFKRLVGKVSRKNYQPLLKYQ